MPPTARLPTVRFLSLLSPPIRIGLKTLHNFVRPQCATAPSAATCLAQRRSLHLYKTAKATTALGMHKVLDFDRYHLKPPSESKHKVNLVASMTDRRVIAEGLSLQELYDNHVDHGKILYMVDPVLKKNDGLLTRLQEHNVHLSNNNYALVDAGSIPHNVKNSQKARKQLGALKNCIFLLSTPPAHTRLLLDRSYQFIEHGSPVEFRIRLSGTGQEKKADGQPDLVPWMFEHFPHMRPDFLLKSMPAGTEYLIQPFTNGAMVQFVLAVPAQQGPKLDLSVRLERVKNRVKDTIHVNRMALNYLNKKERRERIAQGTPPEVIIAERRKEKELRQLKNVSTPILNDTFSASEKKMLKKMERKSKMVSADQAEPANPKLEPWRVKLGKKMDRKIAGQTAERWAISHDDAGGETQNPPSPRHRKNRWDGRGSRQSPKERF